MSKGEIFFGKNNLNGNHPIVYLRRHDKNFFIGAMLTKSSNHSDNILMEKGHFKKKNSVGEKFDFFFNNTHLVNTELMKKDEWKPFKKVGELTNKGIKFIESKISGKNPKIWEDYLSQKTKI